jgi:L-threonylcarbamoyladenylate synthase
MTAVDDAAAAARRGELIAFPTDTVYGLACRPDDPAATDRAFDAKRRPKDLTLPVLVPSIASARDVATFDDRAERLALAFWPGGLTIVLPRSAASAPWALGGTGDSIGVRVPGHPLALAVLRAAGPLAVTSANRSGEPPARTCEELCSMFGDLVSVYLCQDGHLDGDASTVVDLAHGPARLARAGAVTQARIEDILGAEAPLLDSPSPKVMPSR